MDGVVAISGGSEKREAQSSVMAGDLFEFAQQVLRVDISSLAAKAAGQSP